jgi:hypothetical protein
MSQPAPTFRPTGMRPRSHRDGSLTYWSVTRQQVIPRARTMHADDYFAHDKVERYKLDRHIAIHGWTYCKPPAHQWTASPCDA